MRNCKGPGYGIRQVANSWLQLEPVTSVFIECMLYLQPLCTASYTGIVDEADLVTKRSFLQTNSFHTPDYVTRYSLQYVTISDGGYRPPSNKKPWLWWPVTDRIFVLPSFYDTSCDMYKDMICIRV